MIRRRTRRPRRGCPARQGNGTSISAADFTFVVHDCVTGPDGHPTITEVFGYFRLPGDEHKNDALLTAVFEVPAGSPIASLAYQVAAAPDGPQKAAAVLRRNVTRCPCTAAECPALGQISLLDAIEHATGATQWATATTPDHGPAKTPSRRRLARDRRDGARRIPRPVNILTQDKD